jgi:hypothetical protein
MATTPFSALAGVGLDRAPGKHLLASDGQTVEVAVRTRRYPSYTITVPPRFVQPPKEVQARTSRRRDISDRSETVQLRLEDPGRLT